METADEANDPVTKVMRTLNQVKKKTRKKAPLYDQWKAAEHGGKEDLCKFVC